MAPSRSEALVEEFVELPNGCICCTVKDRSVCTARARAGISFSLTVPSWRSFLQSLEALLLKRDKFDFILVETTGTGTRVSDALHVSAAVMGQREYMRMPF